ncbi:HlyD family efflux transporter periplasmic adaptor subunit, partial [Thermodesulfobacteriota bacterium]
AQDLRKMQVETSVDEADIGKLHVGQKATFTVDTYPGRKFPGVVEQIRKSPQEMQNVVTYTVIVALDNSDLALLPGMTATVRVSVKNLKDVLKVPNAALRFRPPGGDSASDTGSGSGGTSGGGGSSPRQRLEKLIESLEMTKQQEAKVWDMFAKAKERVFAQMAQGAGQTQVQAAIATERQRMQKAITAMLTPEQKEKQQRMLVERRTSQKKPGRVWLKGEDGKPTAVDLVVGITDGAFSHVVSGELKEGQDIIVGMDRPSRKH